MDTKVFVLGLDGATFDLILPWANQGKLPNFSRLLEQGSWAPLESVPNMRSPAAWTSFMTGKNPGKHGIFEFYEPIPHTYDVRFIHGGMRKGKTLWTILSEQGKRVGVINVPMTYPAEAVNGFLITGLESPGPGSLDFCYPQTLLHELQRRFGTYILEPGLTGCLVGGKPDLAVQKLHEELGQKERITNYLIRAYPWDFFMVVLRSLDAVQHCFWKYMDPLHPQHNPVEAERYGSVILEAYQQIDRTLGSIWETLDENTILVVMSDHGFGRKHPVTNQLNRWLADQGFLNYLNKGKENFCERLFTTLLGEAYRVLIGRTPRNVKEKLARRLPQLRNRVQTRLCFSNIDWSQTKAYSDGLFPNVRINLKGKEPEGIVKSGEEYWKLIVDLRRMLGKCQDSVSGRKIVDRVFHRDELYSGPFVKNAPDLLIHWKNDEEIHGLSLENAAMVAGGTEEETGPLIPGEDPEIISGDHRLHGVLLMAGKPIQRGLQLSRAHLIDLAPTILHFFNLPIPSDMDGSILREAFREKVISVPTLQSIDEVKKSMDDNTEKEYFVEEEEAIAKRLRDLGYI